MRTRLARGSRGGRAGIGAHKRRRGALERLRTMRASAKEDAARGGKADREASGRRCGCSGAKARRSRRRGEDRPIPAAPAIRPRLRGISGSPDTVPFRSAPAVSMTEAVYVARNAPRPGVGTTIAARQPRKAGQKRERNRARRHHRADMPGIWRGPAQQMEGPHDQRRHHDGRHERVDRQSRGRYRIGKLRGGTGASRADCRSHAQGAWVGGGWVSARTGSQRCLQDHLKRQAAPAQLLVEYTEPLSRIFPRPKTVRPLARHRCTRRNDASATCHIQAPRRECDQALPPTVRRPRCTGREDAPERPDRPPRWPPFSLAAPTPSL